MTSKLSPSLLPSGSNGVADGVNGVTDGVN